MIMYREYKLNNVVADFAGNIYKIITKEPYWILDGKNRHLEIGHKYQLEDISGTDIYVHQEERKIPIEEYYMKYIKRD